MAAGVWRRCSRSTADVQAGVGAGSVDKGRSDSAAARDRRFWGRRFRRGGEDGGSIQPRLYGEITGVEDQTSGDPGVKVIGDHSRVRLSQ
jgi:hypothetical protein